MADAESSEAMALAEAEASAPVATAEVNTSLASLPAEAVELGGAAPAQPEASVVAVAEAKAAVAPPKVTVPAAPAATAPAAAVAPRVAEAAFCEQSPAVSNPAPRLSKKKVEAAPAAPAPAAPADPAQPQPPPDQQQHSPWVMTKRKIESYKAAIRIGERRRWAEERRAFETFGSQCLSTRPTARVCAFRPGPSGRGVTKAQLRPKAQPQPQGPQSQAPPKLDSAASAPQTTKMADVAVAEESSDVLELPIVLAKEPERVLDVEKVADIIHVNLTALNEEVVIPRSKTGTRRSGLIPRPSPQFHEVCPVSRGFGTSPRLFSDVPASSTSLYPVAPQVARAVDAFSRAWREVTKDECTHMSLKGSGDEAFEAKDISSSGQIPPRDRILGGLSSLAHRQCTSFGTSGLGARFEKGSVFHRAPCKPTTRIATFRELRDNLVPLKQGGHTVAFFP